MHNATCISAQERVDFFSPLPTPSSLFYPVFLYSSLPSFPSTLHFSLPSFLPSFFPSFLHSSLHSILCSFLPLCISSILHSSLPSSLRPTFIPPYIPPFLPLILHPSLHSSLPSFIFPQSFLHALFHSCLPFPPFLIPANPQVDLHLHGEDSQLRIKQRELSEQKLRKKADNKRLLEMKNAYKDILANQRDSQSKDS